MQANTQPRFISDDPELNGLSQYIFLSIHVLLTTLSTLYLPPLAEGQSVCHLSKQILHIRRHAAFIWRQPIPACMVSICSNSATLKTFQTLANASDVIISSLLRVQNVFYKQMLFWASYLNLLWWTSADLTTADHHVYNPLPLNITPLFHLNVLYLVTAGGMKGPNNEITRTPQLFLE